MANLHALARYATYGALIGMSLLSVGCVAGLDVQPVATSAQQPSNVAVYVSVTDNGQPITDLNSASFRIYEDGKRVGTDKTEQTLLERDVAVVHRTVLLVDMSSAEGEQAKRSLSRAAAAFVSRVRRTQDVTVLAFDGSEGVTEVGDYPRDASENAGPEEVEKLSSFEPKDASRNLNGAVVDALNQLDAKLMAVKKPVRVGTLVVFTAGPDLAGRVATPQVEERIRQSGHHVFAVGIKDHTKDLNLKGLGPDGTELAQSPNTVGPALMEAGSKVTASFNGHYLLAYCSPSRAGTRSLRIEVTTAGADGKEKKGSLRTEFDASGFTSGCDPKATPQFVTTGTAVSEPAAEEPAAEPEPPAEKPAPAPAPKPAAPPAAPAPAPKPAPEQPPQDYEP